MVTHGNVTPMVTQNSKQLQNRMVTNRNLT